MRIAILNQHPPYPATRICLFTPSQFATWKHSLAQPSISTTPRSLILAWYLVPCCTGPLLFQAAWTGDVKLAAGIDVPALLTQHQANGYANKSGRILVSVVRPVFCDCSCRPCLFGDEKHAPPSDSEVWWYFLLLAVLVPPPVSQPHLPPQFTFTTIATSLFDNTR